MLAGDVARGQSKAAELTQPPITHLLSAHLLIHRLTPGLSCEHTHTHTHTHKYTDINTHTETHTKNTQ